MYANTQVIGYVGREPELSYTPAGQAVAHFSLATSRKWTNKETGEKREETTWWRVSAFAGTAEIAGKYLHKGSKCFVEGRVSARAWADKQGKPQAELELTAERLLLLDSKAVNGQGGEAAAEAQGNGPDNLPF